MLLLEFTSNNKPLIINPKKIVSIHPTRDGRTEITTTNYKLDYITDLNLLGQILYTHYVVQFLILGMLLFYFF